MRYHAGPTGEDPHQSSIRDLIAAANLRNDTALTPVEVHDSCSDSCSFFLLLLLLLYYPYFQPILTLISANADQLITEIPRERSYFAKKEETSQRLLSYMNLRIAAVSDSFSHAMSCYVMLCSVMLCYVMLCYVILCYANLYYVMLCNVMFCYVM